MRRHEAGILGFLGIRQLSGFDTGLGSEIPIDKIGGSQPDEAARVRAPETVLDVTEESQPGRPAGVRLGSVMSSQNAPDEVFINGDAERQSNLLGDARAAPGGIALFGGDNCVNEFFGGTLGTGLAHGFRGEKQVVLALGQDLVKVQ